ncbi:hypothetical protein [Scytonema sp. NUACC26]|uniref:hypothetical protein n=1 Tax=Scytonema sp. NUACC26 TaxID=3140176 RepID=UPI0034DCB5C5
MIIELSGTPSAGKNSIIKRICLNDKDPVNCLIITQDDDEFTMKNSNFDLRILWGIFDTYLKTRKAINTHDPLQERMLIFNRGLFDMIAWTRLLRSNNECYAEVANYIEKWLITHLFLFQTDMIFLFLTSYEKILTRREKYKFDSNGTPWVINPNTIGKLNEIYLELFLEFRRDFSIIVIDDVNENLSLEQKFTIVRSHLIKFL